MAHWFKNLITIIGALGSWMLLGATAALAGSGNGETLDLTGHGVGYFAILIFAIALFFVVMEEKFHLRKSKPVILAAGIIWTAIALVYASSGMPHAAEAAARHGLLEYAELCLFLLVAMTYINAMTERRVFDALRSWLVNQGFSLRALFWITGILSFFISPIADNLTTSLLMGAVVMAVAGNNIKFISVACTNIVVAANAGGAFSPFGDITTLMVWQRGIVDFATFFNLFIPSVVSYIVPAFLMSLVVGHEKPEALNENVTLKDGAIRTVLLFFLTIATAVSFHNFLHLPPVFGMMTGLAYLQFFGYYLKLYSGSTWEDKPIFIKIAPLPKDRNGKREHGGFDVFDQVAQSEWDTLLFFYGIVMCVSGLGFIGYLSVVSEIMYTQWGPTWANAAVGVISAIVDNIPVMFAVLTMMPEMDTGQWLLVTLTAGTGGSLLSVGSAAGVALMGQAHGKYTFFGHLKWMPAIALGYALSIACHFVVNASFFTQ